MATERGNELLGFGLENDQLIQKFKLTTLKDATDGAGNQRGSHHHAPERQVPLCDQSKHHHGVRGDALRTVQPRRSVT